MSSTSNGSEVTDNEDDTSRHDSEQELNCSANNSGVDDDERVEQDASFKSESDNRFLNEDSNTSSHDIENHINEEITEITDSQGKEEEISPQALIENEDKTIEKKDTRIELATNDLNSPDLSYDSIKETNHEGSKREEHCGVLSKRRDIFKNQWRDRYFILNHERGELSYYLIPRNNKRGNNKRQGMNKKRNDINIDNDVNKPDEIDDPDNQDQEEIIGTLEVDINLEPRGVIYLSANTSVRILSDNELFRNNRQRKRQNEQNQMFGFVITTPSLRKRDTIKNKKQKQKQKNGRKQNPNIASVADTSDFNDNILSNTNNQEAKSSRKDNQNNDMNNNGYVTYLSAHSENDRNIWVQQISATCASMKLKARSFSHSSSYDDNDQLPPPLDWRLKYNKNELFDNVPDSITHKIQEMMNASISILCNDIQANNPSMYNGTESEDAYVSTNYTQQSWEPLWHKDGMTAVKKQQDNAFMVKCEKILNHDINDIFHLLWDIHQKPRYESNITSAKRLFTYNPNTFLDYYVALPLNEAQKVKEFCVLSHWQILRDDKNESVQMSQNTTNEKYPSLLFFSFSHDSHLCPENESKFSRANLILSAWLLEEYDQNNTSVLMEPSSDLSSASGRHGKKCKIRFVFSMDFHDEDLSSIIFDNLIDQHALLPSSIEKYLDYCQTQKENVTANMTDVMNVNVLDKEIKKENLSERDASYASMSDLNNTAEMMNMNTISKKSSNAYISLKSSNISTENTDQTLSSRSYSRENMFLSHSSSFNDDKNSPLSPHNLGSSTDSVDSELDNGKKSTWKNTTNETEEGKSEIDEVASVSITTITSPHIMNAVLFLSCSTSWVVARNFPTFYPYRGFIFTFLLSTCVFIRSGIAKAVITKMKFFLIGSKDSLPQSIAKDEATLHHQSTSSFVFNSMLFIMPSFSWYMASNLYPNHKEIIFVVTFYFTLYFMVRRMLGVKITYPDGSAVGYDDVEGHVGLGTEKFTSRFVVDLKGVLRFIGNKREENKEAHLQNIQNNGNSNSVSDSEVAVSHIVVKAIALAMSEMSIFNTTRINIPLLGIQGCYQRKRIDVSVVAGIHRLSKGANHALLIKDVNKLSIRGIANDLSMKSNSLMANKTDKDKTDSNALHLITWFMSLLISCFIGTKAMKTIKGIEKFGSCVVLTSPNTENSDVDVEVSPSSALGVNMVAVVGGVRVMRDTRGGSIRPALSMSITINCPPANMASCRKFAERVQQLVQFPEICE